MPTNTATKPPKGSTDPKPIVWDGKDGDPIRTSDKPKPPPR